MFCLELLYSVEYKMQPWQGPTYFQTGLCDFSSIGDSHFQSHVIQIYGEDAYSVHIFSTIFVETFASQNQLLIFKEQLWMSNMDFYIGQAQINSAANSTL